jgi:hypothetical protein
MKTHKVVIKSNVINDYVELSEKTEISQFTNSTKKKLLTAQLNVLSLMKRQFSTIPQAKSTPYS